MATTVILGSGIIGVSTAYYLSEHQSPSSIHLVEPSPKLFASATGYAGGFLAKNWFGGAVSSLGALSFDLHRDFAEKHDGKAKWGYGPTTCFNYTGPGGQSGKNGADWLNQGTSRAGAAPEPVEPYAGSFPEWFRRQQGDSMEFIGGEGTTAQLEPIRLAQFLLDECQKRGVHLHQPAQAVSVSKDSKHQVSSVRVADLTSSTESDIPCTRIVIAAGSWSPRVFQSLFPKSDIALPITSLAGHSIVIKSPRWVESMEDKGMHSVYTTHPAGYCPEMYAWLGGHLYFAGLNSADIPLPRLPTESKVLGPAMEELKRTAAEMLGNETGESDYEVVREGLCFRPVTPWGAPIMVRVPDQHLGGGLGTRAGAEGGVFVSAGHGPWGISMSLASGKVLAEVMQGRQVSADIRELGLHAAECQSAKRVAAKL